MKYPYPVMYQNVYCYDEMKRAEHMAVRETVGWYLWTHQIVEVTGKDATVFLEKLFPKPIGNLALSRERYTTMLDDNAQIIDDVNGVTLVSANTLEKEFEGATGNCEAAKKVGAVLAERAKEKGIEEVVFDRGGYVYHGRIAALADGAREAGLKF